MSPNFEFQETKPHSRHHHKENIIFIEKDESTTEFGQPSKIVNKSPIFPFISYSNCLVRVINLYEERRNLVRHMSVFILVCINIVILHLKS